MGLDGSVHIADMNALSGLSVLYIGERMKEDVSSSRCSEAPRLVEVVQAVALEGMNVEKKYEWNWVYVLRLYQYVGLR